VREEFSFSIEVSLKEWRLDSGRWCLISVMSVDELTGRSFYLVLVSTQSSCGYIMGWLQAVCFFREAFQKVSTL